MKLLITSVAALLALTACDQLGMGGGNDSTGNTTANAVVANEAAPVAPDANAAKPADGAATDAAPTPDPAASGDKPAEGGDQPEPAAGDKPAG